MENNNSIKKNLEALTGAIEWIWFDPRITDKYLQIQALYQREYGTIPSVGSVHAWLKGKRMAGHNKQYSQRETEGSYIYTSKLGKQYRMIQIEQGRWEPEHVLIAKALGTYKKGSVVHHIDGDGTNNMPTNLVVMSRSEHSRLHQLERCSNPEYRANISKRMKAYWAKRRLADRIAKINNNGKEAA